MEEDFVRVNTMNETDRKCPDCGATMDFSPDSGGLYCQYCGHKEDVPANEPIGNDAAEELDFLNAEKRGNCDWGANKKTVICKSCGAESVYDALAISNECPYCGSNQVMDANDVETLAPGGVCPFQITEKQAGSNFASWIKGKLFCPSAAKKSARPDAFKGVYLPYWTFDSDTHSSYTARYGRDRTVRDKDGNTHIETDWYSTSGQYDEFFDDELVLASSHHDRDLLSRIEPFNTADNKSYRPEYVAGFISERYSIGLDSGWEVAKASIHSKLEDHISSDIKSRHHADHVSGLNVSTMHDKVTYKYLLLPIWLSSFKFKSKIYQFLVNGQTGKVGGKTPISALRVTIAVVMGIAVCALLYWLFNK